MTKIHYNPLPNEENEIVNIIDSKISKNERQAIGLDTLKEIIGEGITLFTESIPNCIDEETGCLSVRSYAEITRKFMKESLVKVLDKAFTKHQIKPIDESTLKLINIFTDNMIQGFLNCYPNQILSMCIHQVPIAVYVHFELVASSISAYIFKITALNMTRME